MLETREQRYERYFKHNMFWFASNPDMEKWGEEQVKKGRLKRLWELVPRVGEKTDVGDFKTTWAYTFIPIEWEIKDLLKVFDREFLIEAFGLCVLAPNYQI